MRRFGSLVGLALVTALGCKSNGTHIYNGFLDIYVDLDAGPSPT